MKPIPDWIITGDGSNPDYPWGFTCLRCGMKEKLPQTVRVDEFVDRGRKFMEKHGKCELRTWRGIWK